MVLRVLGFGFRDLGFRVLGFRVLGLGCSESLCVAGCFRIC